MRENGFKLKGMVMESSYGKILALTKVNGAIIEEMAKGK
jgi:hypothetical protein